MSADPMHLNPVDAPTCGDFGGRRKDGQACGSPAIAGTKRCRMHSGKPRRLAKAEGAVVLELQRWGLDGHATLRDAGEVLLRLVTQSAARVELYAGLLAAAFEAAERLRAASEAQALVLFDADGEVAESAAVQAARLDLDRVFNTGGVAALVGVTLSATQAGGVYATGEALRGLARLEAEERDRCASFAAKAVAAGLAEREVRLAERHVELSFAIVRGALGALGHSLSDPAVLVAIEAQVRQLAGGVPAVIEGSLS